MHRRTAWLAVAVAIALAVSACSDGGGDPRASEGAQSETDAPAVESPQTDLADAVAVESPQTDLADAVPWTTPPSEARPHSRRSLPTP